MRFLVDAQLPPRLASWLTAGGHEARHVSAVPDGLVLPDAEIRDHAIAAREIIVTKDQDFLDLATLHGTPPAVLLVALGNCSTADLLTALDTAWISVERAFARNDTTVVMVERERVVVLSTGDGPTSGGGLA